MNIPRDVIMSLPDRVWLDIISDARCTEYDLAVIEDGDVIAHDAVFYDLRVADRLIRRTKIQVS
jgi:hypothetical protein